MLMMDDVLSLLMIGVIVVRMMVSIFFILNIATKENYSHHLYHPSQFPPPIRLAECQIFYTDENLSSKFYPNNA